MGGRQASFILRPAGQLGKWCHWAGERKGKPQPLSGVRMAHDLFVSFGPGGAAAAKALLVVELLIW